MKFSETILALFKCRREAEPTEQAPISAVVAPAATPRPRPKYKNKNRHRSRGAVKLDPNSSIIEQVRHLARKGKP